MQKPGWRRSGGQSTLQGTLRASGCRVSPAWAASGQQEQGMQQGMHQSRCDGLYCSPCFQQFPLSGIRSSWVMAELP